MFFKPRCGSCCKRKSDAIDRGHKIYSRVCDACWDRMGKRAEALMTYWRLTREGYSLCDECGEYIPVEAQLVNSHHGEGCSLNPDNVVSDEGDD
jgi:hypothetical protein